LKNEIAADVFHQSSSLIQVVKAMKMAEADIVVDAKQ